MSEKNTEITFDLKYLRLMVFSLLDVSAFSSAKKILESLFVLGDHSPTMQLAYALCLIEMGDHAQASLILENLTRFLDQKDIPSDTSLRMAVAAIVERLPGKRWDPARLTDLQSEAMRLMPTLRK